MLFHKKTRQLKNEEKDVRTFTTLKIKTVVMGMLGLVPLTVLGATPSVPYATVLYQTVPETYAVDALVEAAKQSTLASQVNGRVIQVNFEAGDFVSKGKLLLKIDEREVNQNLNINQAQIAQAQANLINAKANYQRHTQLYQQKFISKAALDNAKAQYDIAQSQVQAAMASSGQTQVTKTYTEIFAPYTSVIAQRLVELGEMATPGKPLLTAFDPKDLRVIANIPQYKLDALRAFQNQNATVKIEIPSLNQWVEVKKITFLPGADTKTHTSQIRLDLAAEVQRLHLIPGMFARAHFVIGQKQKLMLPQEAVLRRSEVTAVYVLHPQSRQPLLRQVRLGERINQHFVEVLSGVQAGEQVALNPIKTGIVAKQTPVVKAE